MNKVYVINRAAHDFSAAEDYGELVFLTDKPINRYSTNKMYRNFREILKTSNKEDYILITSLTIMNILACVIFTLQHNKLNLLIHHPGTNTYIERRLDFSDIQSTSE